MRNGLRKKLTQWDYTTWDFTKDGLGGYVTVTLTESTSGVDILDSQLNYISVEVNWEALSPYRKSCVNVSLERLVYRNFFYFFSM